MKIVQLDKRNKVIERWNSVEEIEQFLEIGRSSIYRSIKNNKRMKNGFLFREVKIFKSKMNTDEKL